MRKRKGEVNEKIETRRSVRKSKKRKGRRKKKARESR